MRAYVAMVDARWRILLQYRAAAFAGVITQLFFGLVRVMIFAAFYRASGGAQPMTAQEVTSYLWLTQAFLLLGMFGPEAEIAAMIRSGAVAYELTRPVDLFSLWYARCIGSRLAPLTLRSIPQLLIAWALLGLTLPPTLGALALFLVALAGSILLASMMSLLLTLSLMWTISGEGVTRIAPALIFLFSGMLIPLPLLPDWAQPVLAALPFRGLMDVPFRIYLEHMHGAEALWAIVQQWAWLLALMICGRWVLRRGVRRLVVQGG